MKLLTIALFALPLLAQTTITDTIYSPWSPSTPWSGTIEVTANCSMTYAGKTYERGSKIKSVSSTGSFTFSIIPNVSASVSGCYNNENVYVAKYIPSAGGQSWTQKWLVPVSSTPVNIASIRVSNPAPASYSWTPAQFDLTSLATGCLYNAGSIMYSTGLACGVYGGGGSGVSVPVYTQTFTAQTSVSVTAATHGFGLSPVVVQVRDNSGYLIDFNSQWNSTTGAVTVTFGVATTGVVYIVGASGPTGPQGPTGPGGDMTNPMTTAGAIIYGGTAGAPTSLPAAIAGGAFVGKVAAKYATTALLREDSGTVAHVMFTPDGIVDTKGNAWTNSTDLAPPIYAIQPPDSALRTTRVSVGPFSDSNYFTQGSAGTGLANINGAFTGCIAYTPTSVSNSPMLFSHYSGGGSASGFLIQAVNNNGVYLIGQGFAGPLTPNKSLAGERNIVCFGVAGTGTTTGYVKLNGGPVTTSSIIYNPSSTATSTFGRYQSATGFSFNGTIEEAWFSTDTPSTASIDAIYRRAVAQTGGGYLFPDSGTVLHLFGADYNGTSWVTPQATLTTVGTVGSSTATAPAPLPVSKWYGASPAATPSNVLATSSFFYLPSGENVLDFSGNFSACVVAMPTASDISGTSIYASNGVSQGTPGWQLVNEAGLTQLFGDTGSVTDVTATANKLNVICFGKNGSTLYLKVNDRKTVTASGTITAAGSIGRIAMHWGNDIGFQGAMYEQIYSTSAATDTVFADMSASLLGGTGVSLGGTQTLTNKTLTLPMISSISNTGVLTLPTSTDTLVGRATTDTLTNKTLTLPIISSIINTGTLTLPTSTDTLIGKATTDTLTNKTFDTAGSGNVFRINGTAISAVTGTGSVVLSSAPTITGLLTVGSLAAPSGITVNNFSGMFNPSGAAGFYFGSNYTSFRTNTVDDQFMFLSNGILAFGGSGAANGGLKRAGNAVAFRTGTDTVPTFSTLTTCSPTVEGALTPISDSTTGTWGATITGGGSTHVLAYCNGTNWTVR